MQRQNTDDDSLPALLHDAMQSREYDTAHLLIRLAFAGINARFEHGFTPLHYAVRSERIDIAQMAIARGALINATNDSGITPLMYALHGGASVEMIRLLVNAGADVTACDKKSWHCVTIIACCNCPLATLRIVVEAGADIDGVDDAGRTPLHHAGMWTDAHELARQLVVYGARVDVVSNDGNTALDECRFASTAAVLFAAGAERRTSTFNPAAMQHKIAQAKRRIAKERFELIRERTFQICLALQAMELPAFVALAIVDADSKVARLTPTHFKWDVIVAVAHLRAAVLH